MTKLFNFTALSILAITMLVFSGCDSSRISAPGMESVVVPSPNLLDFGNFDTVRTLTLRSTRGDSLNWKVQSSSIYVEVSPDSGYVTHQPVTLTILIHRTPRNIGTSTHSIRLTETVSDLKSTIQVKFSNLAPELVLSTALLDFGRHTDSLSLSLTNSGSHNLHWSVEENYPWLNLSPTEGFLVGEPKNVLVSLNRDSLPPGDLVKAIQFRHGQISKELAIKFQEGEMIWGSNFESEANLLEFWDIWDQDTGQLFGIDTWGIVRDFERGGKVLWCNGQGIISSGIPGHDGGINANFALKSAKYLDLSRHKMVTFKLQMLREFYWQDELLRLYFSGFEDGILVSYSTSSNGWESFDYSFTNNARFPQPINIQFNYLASNPAEGLVGAKIDDLEVWVK